MISFMFMDLFDHYFCRIFQELHLEFLDRLPVQKNANFLMVDLREVFTLRDLWHSKGISKKLYDTNLICLTYQKIIAHEVQYCIGRQFLLLSPIWYNLVQNSKFFVVDLRENFT